MRILLQAKDDNEKIIQDYLEENASDTLAEKINNGKKTLADCWNYIISEAKSRAKSGCCVMRDAEVFGLSIHFFEEDEIKVAKKQEAPRVEVKKAPEPEKKPEPKKVQPKNNPAQFSIEDWLGGMT